MLAWRLDYLIGECLFLGGRWQSNIECTKFEKEATWGSGMSFEKIWRMKFNLLHVNEQFCAKLWFQVFCLASILLYFFIDAFFRCLMLCWLLLHARVTQPRQPVALTPSPTHSQAATSSANLLTGGGVKYFLPWEPTTCNFRGYNPYIGGLKPSFFMVLGSKGTFTPRGKIPI